MLLRTGSCGHDNERDVEAVNMKKMQRGVVWYKFSNISEEHAASIFSVKKSFLSGRWRGTSFLRSSAQFPVNTRRHVPEENSCRGVAAM